MYLASPAPVLPRDAAPLGPVWTVSPPLLVADCDATPPAVLMIGVVVADALTIGGQPVVQPHSSLGASPYW